MTILLKHAHLAIQCAEYRVRYISKHAHLAIECAQYRVRYISKHAHLATGDSNDDITHTGSLRMAQFMWVKHNSD